MKKTAILAGVVVVVAAAYTGAAWLVGAEAEKKIRAAIEHNNQKIERSLGKGSGVTTARIEVREYQRGIFSSQAHYVVQVRDGDEQYELGMHDDMQHGPFPWGLIRRGEFSPMLAYSRSRLDDTQAVKHWFDAARGANPLEADTRIQFNGDGVSVWQFAPLQWSGDEGSVSFSGGRIEVSFSNEFRDSAAQGHFDELVLGDPTLKQTLSLKSINVDSNMNTDADQSVQMRSEMQVDRIALADASGDILSLAGFTARFDSQQKARLLDATMRYDVKSMYLGDIDLGSVSLGGELRNLDFEAFSALLAEYDAISREHDAAGGQDIELTEAQEQRLLEKLKPVLAGGPEAALEPAVWRNEKGESVLAFRAVFQPWPDTASKYAEEVLPGALQSVQFELSVSRAMLLQAIAQGGANDADKQLAMLAALMFDQYVARLEDEGLVRREGDIARTNIRYEEGSIDVNGQTMGVSDFFSRYGGYLP